MKLILKLALVLVALVVTVQLAWAAIVTWNPGYEGTPAGGDPVSQGDDRIRELKENVRERLETEIEYGTQIGPDTGRMREGSGRAYYQAAAPTTIPQPDINGANALGATDDGRLWRDSDAGSETLSVWNGSAWVQAVQRFFSALVVDSTVSFGTNSWLCRPAAANCFDPHEHGARHSDVITGAGVGEDYIQYLIANVQQNNGGLVSVSNNAGFDCATAGEAASIAYNVAGRRDTSRALVIATGYLDNSAVGAANETATIGLCEGAANLDGSTQHRRIIGAQTVSPEHEAFAIVYYWAAAPNANHTVTLEADSAAGGDLKIVGHLVIVDLGVTSP